MRYATGDKVRRRGMYRSDCSCSSARELESQEDFPTCEPCRQRVSWRLDRLTRGEGAESLSIPARRRARVTMTVGALLLMFGAATFGLLWHRTSLRTRLGDDSSARAWVGERGAMEHAQLGVLLLCAANGVRLIAKGRRLGWILVPAALVVVVREADWVLDALVGRNAHRPIMVVLVVLTLGAAWRQRAVLLQASTRLLRGVFSALLVGAMILLIAAQILGHPDEWTQLAREGDAARVAKRYVEEGLELLAYLQALVATLFLWGTRRSDVRQPVEA